MTKKTLTWKITIAAFPAIMGRFTAKFPVGAEFINMISLDLAGNLSFWFHFDEANSQNLEERTFQLIGTGYELELWDGEYVEHLASTITATALVFHLYEIRKA